MTGAVLKIAVRRRKTGPNPDSDDGGLELRKWVRSWPAATDPCEPPYPLDYFTAAIGL